MLSCLYEVIKCSSYENFYREFATVLVLEALNSCRLFLDTRPVLSSYSCRFVCKNVNIEFLTAIVCFWIQCQYCVHNTCSFVWIQCQYCVHNRCSFFWMQCQYCVHNSCSCFSGYNSNIVFITAVAFFLDTIPILCL